MTQKRTTAKEKTPVTAKKVIAKKTSVLKPTQKIIDAKVTKAPTPKTPTSDQVQDFSWMEWVEYAQSRMRYLENQLEEAKAKIEELKLSNKRLNDRIMAG